MTKIISVTISLIILVLGPRNHVGAVCDETGAFFTQVFTTCTNQLLAFSSTPELQAYALRRICGDLSTARRTCITDRFTTCSQEYRDKLNQWAEASRQKACTDTGQLKEPELVEIYIQQLIDPIACYKEAKAKAESCIDPFRVFGYLTSYEQFRHTWSKWLVSYVKCFRDELRRAQCHPTDVRKFTRGLLVYADFYGSTVQLDDVRAAPDVVARSGPRSTVGAYGDPHLKIFKADQLVTCGDIGPLGYLTNDYVSISVDHALAATGSPPTFMNKIQIVLYSSLGRQQASYTASAGALPATFDSGTASIGTGNYQTDITKVSAQLVVLRHHAGGIAITITARGLVYSSLWVRLSDSLLKESHGVMVAGCINQVGPASGQAPTSECTGACAGVPTLYTDACLFDCATTGDTHLATSAANDAVIANKRAHDEDPNVTDDRKWSGGARMSTSSSLVVATFLFCLMIILWPF